MNRLYRSQVSWLTHAAPYAKIGVRGGLLALASISLWLLRLVLLKIPENCFIRMSAIYTAAFWLDLGAFILLMIGALLFLAAVCMRLFAPNTARIQQNIRRGLCCPAYGNPLKLRDGELLPTVSCEEVDKGVYDIKITAIGKSQDELLKVCSVLSGYLRGRFANLAVVDIAISETCNYVTYRVDDVLADKSITYHSVDEMQPSAPYKLAVQRGTEIDLTTSGSILVAGKTRSGKTTGVIALLLQVLSQGRDKFGSEVVIIDPKQAELSRLPHVVTLDENGEARTILERIKAFEAAIKPRQDVLNDLSEQTGDAVHWWDAGMRPSLLFIDEYVACRSLFPKKAAKGDDYCLETFDDLIKRIVTMGASAGCYVIISIAQASVDAGGLPSMLRSAMGTRILFRPTKEEGRFLWEGDCLEAVSRLPAQKQGDAWFSSTDGEHDAVSRVHFPRMLFPVYRALRRLLRRYYDD